MSDFRSSATAQRKFDHVYATCGVLSILIGLVLAFSDNNFNTAWGWIAGSVPYFILARKS